MRHLLKRCTALVGVASLLQPALMGAALANSTPVVTVQPNLNATVSQYALDPASADPVLSHDDMAALVRNKIKYVFVLFNENESFDHEYGTFPGVNGLYSDGVNPRTPANTPGFTQSVTDVNGGSYTVQPFRIGSQQNATFMDSVDHSHTGLANKLHTVLGAPQMTGFAQDEYTKYASSPAASAAAQAKGKQFSELVMSHIDCETIPFFWQYANRFTIFDNIFATEDTPSTPNAIAMLAGQAGESQWVQHGSTASPMPISGTINGVTYSGSATPSAVPVVNDPQPYWGSAFDTTPTNRRPTGPKEFWGPTNSNINLTFASVPLSLAGSDINAIVAGDHNKAGDLADVQNDIKFLATHGGPKINWRWYENGYADHEANEPSFATPGAHTNYVSHHNGAQYFGYISNNYNEWQNMKGEHDLFVDLQNNAALLPKDGGVFYVRGGYYNTNALLPPIQNSHYPNTAGLTPTEIATINAAKSGDDDHPGYSDHQITEAMNARVINAIASNPELWAQSAIIITYDESDGFYDHVPPRILSYGPDSLPLSRGVRIPLILISPYARAGAVAHAEGDHNSVIETINAIFGLTPLSQLPDEAAALAAGNTAAFNQFAAAQGPAGFQQTNLGPRDTNTPTTDSLLSGFSPARLKGQTPILPGSYAMIPNRLLYTLPHYAGDGCKTIGVTPTDAAAPTAPPAGFNTLPSTLPAYN